MDSCPAVHQKLGEIWIWIYSSGMEPSKAFVLDRQDKAHYVDPAELTAIGKPCHYTEWAYWPIGRAVRPLR